MDSPVIRKNPSRVTCEQNIRRILMTEVLENGGNKHFKTAADFMKYFEALYPAGDALTKQVQRAVKSMNMPKDENGYYIVNKTHDQFDQEKELTDLFTKAQVVVNPMDEVETVFLQMQKELISYISFQMQQAECFKDKYITFVECANGLLIYTQNKKQLLILLNSLTI